MRSQSMYITMNAAPKIRENLPRKDWREYQHLATQGRYIQPKLFSGFQNQRIRLTTVKRQLYNPRLPSTRRIERAEALCRLADEHYRHTTAITKEQFQTFDPKREESFIEFSGLNWHNTGKALLGVHDSSFMQNESSLDFGARLRPDKSLKDPRFSQGKFSRSSSLLAKSSSAILTKPIQYSYLNNPFDQSSRTLFHLSTKTSSESTEGIFRSSSMYADESAPPWIPIGRNDGWKSSRV